MSSKESSLLKPLPKATSGSLGGGQQKTMRNASSMFASALPLILLGLFYLVSIIAINPLGNFPLNDDWVYGEGVKTYLQTGNMSLPTTCSACFLHVWFGAFACKAFGFSYSVLRCVTVAFGAIGTAALYFALREMRMSKMLSGFISLAYIANPLILSLCFSWMTDISSFAFTNLYILFMVRGIRRTSLADFAWASGMLACAIAIRQGACIFIAANICVLAVYLLAARRVLKPGQIIALVTMLVIVPVGVTISLEKWLTVSDKLSDSYIWFKQRHMSFVHELFKHPGKALFALTVIGGQVLCYLGLYLLPILISFLGFFGGLFTKSSKILACWFAASAAVITTSLTKLVVGENRLMPFNQNMLRLPVIGAPNILGVSVPLLSNKVRFWLTQTCGVLAFLWFAIFLAGCHRTFQMLVKAVLRPASQRNLQPVLLHVFCFAMAAISLAAVVFETTVLDVDRHYLLALVPVLICSALSFRLFAQRPTWIISWTLLILMAFYSVCATEDMLAWNRARWLCAESLEAQGINPKDIDGGAEYDFVHDIFLWVKTFRNEDINGNPRNIWRWWRVNDDKYIVSFSPVPGYEEIGKQEYWSGLTFSKKAVLILRRL